MHKHNYLMEQILVNRRRKKQKKDRRLDLLPMADLHLLALPPPDMAKIQINLKQKMRDQRILPVRMLHLLVQLEALIRNPE